MGHTEPPTSDDPVPQEPSRAGVTLMSGVGGAFVGFVAAGILLSSSGILTPETTPTVSAPPDNVSTSGPNSLASLNSESFQRKTAKGSETFDAVYLTHPQDDYAGGTPFGESAEYASSFFALADDEYWQHAKLSVDKFSQLATTQSLVIDPNLANSVDVWTSKAQPQDASVEPPCIVVQSVEYPALYDTFYPDRSRDEQYILDRSHSILAAVVLLKNVDNTIRDRLSLRQLPRPQAVYRLFSGDYSAACQIVTNKQLVPDTQLPLGMTARERLGNKNAIPVSGDEEWLSDEYFIVAGEDKLHVVYIHSTNGEPASQIRRWLSQFSTP